MRKVKCTQSGDCYLEKSAQTGRGGLNFQPGDYDVPIRANTKPGKRRKISGRGKKKHKSTKIKRIGGRRKPTFGKRRHKKRKRKNGKRKIDNEI